MIRRVKEAIKSNDKIIDYREILVEDNELAEKLNFRGSPTVLVNGKDLEADIYLKLLHLTVEFMKMVYLQLKISKIS